MEHLETVRHDLPSRGLIQSPCIINDNVPLFYDRSVVRVIVAVTVTASKDLATTIERGLYGCREVGGLCVWIVMAMW